MKSPHDSEISVVKQPQVAQPTFSTHLDSLTAQCSTWPFFWVLRRNRCSMSVPKTPRRKMILFFVNFSCLFSFYGSSPDFMGGLLLLQTRSFGQTPLANVFSEYIFRKNQSKTIISTSNMLEHIFSNSTEKQPSFWKTQLTQLPSESSSYWGLCEIRVSQTRPDETSVTSRGKILNHNHQPQ